MKKEGKITKLGHNDIAFACLTLTKNHNKALEMREFLPTVGAGSFVQTLLLTAATCDKFEKQLNEHVIKKKDIVELDEDEFTSLISAISLGAVLVTTLEHYRDRAEQKKKEDEEKTESAQNN